MYLPNLVISSLYGSAAYFLYDLRLTFDSRIDPKMRLIIVVLLFHTFISLFNFFDEFKDN